MSGCKIDGCSNDASSLHMCNMHYKRFKKHGSAMADKPSRKGPDLLRLESQTSINEATQCWEWTGSKNAKGYGKLWFSPLQRVASAHRVSYSIRVGEIPDGLHVLHKCDNPGCVNPAHLFLGTNQDNMDDMVRKGRHADFRGSNGGNAKLNEASAMKILTRVRSGESLGSLADEFGVSKRTVLFIKQRITWKNIEEKGAANVI